MIESILPTLSAGLLGGPSSPTVAPEKKANVPTTVTVKDAAPPKPEEVPAAKMLECDYDLNASDLYQAIEAKQWDYAISLFDKDDKVTAKETKEDDEPASGSVEEQARTWVVRKESNGKLRWRLLPLHAGIIFGSPVKLIELMLEAYPQGAHHKDDQGMLPLHLAFRNEASWELMEELLTAHPQAIHVKDRKGRTPLDCGARSVSSAISIASATNSLASKQPLSAEQQKAMKDHVAFRNVVNIIEVWSQIVVSGERQRGLQESRSVLESRISQMQESHLSTLTTLKKEWQAQQESAAAQVQEMHQANMTLQGQLHDAGHALQVAKAHYQELQEELSYAKIELMRREEMVHVVEGEKAAIIDDYNKKEEQQYATAVPDTYIVADELHASESMRQQQQLQFEQKEHEFSIKQLQITSVANNQISAYQNTNRVLRRNIDDLVRELKLSQTRFSDLIIKYQSLHEDRAQLVRNFQRQCLSQAEQELANVENARMWLAESKRRLQDQQTSLAEEKKVEDMLDFVDRTNHELSDELDRIHSPASPVNNYATPVETYSYTGGRSVAESMSGYPSRSFADAASVHSARAESVKNTPPPIDTDEPIAVPSMETDCEEDEDLDAKFAAAMGASPIEETSKENDFSDSMIDPAAPASSPVYERYTRKYGGCSEPEQDMISKAGSSDNFAASVTPIVPAYNVATSPASSPHVIDLSNMASPKSTAA